MYRNEATPNIYWGLGLLAYPLENIQVSWSLGITGNSDHTALIECDDREALSDSFFKQKGGNPGFAANGEEQ